jgi:aryl-alcohol dehydrogenase-like predicted oxidoreductase
MDFRKQTILGKTGLSVSRIGLASGYGGVPAIAVEKAFHEYGINYHFMSNPRNKIMETGLKNLASKNREKLVIAIQSYDHSGLFISRSVDGALKDLGIDYADILILGWHNSIPWNYTISECEKLKKSGKIRFLGMSGHNRTTFGKLAQDPNSPIDVFMTRYNAVHPGAEQDIFPYIKSDSRPGITTYTATAWRKLLKPGNMPQGESPVSAADCYRFVLSNPSVDVCLMALSSEKEMDENLSALAKGPLSDMEMNRIRKIGEYIHGK